MKQTSQIAKHLREVFFGGNWTWSNFKQHIEHTDWLLATTKLHSSNTIAALLNHLIYYVNIEPRYCSWLCNEKLKGNIENCLKLKK